MQPWPWQPWSRVSLERPADDHCNRQLPSLPFSSTSAVQLACANMLSKLSATAAEFRPTAAQAVCVQPTVAVTTSSDPGAKQGHSQAAYAGQPQQHTAAASVSVADNKDHEGELDDDQYVDEYEEYDEYEDYDESLGYYDTEGNWVEHTDWTRSTPTADAHRQEGQLEQHPQAKQQQGVMQGDDAVALLHSCYPTHPRALLQQLLDACDGDVQQAARILSDMDYEKRKARIAAAAAADRPGSTAAITRPNKHKQDFCYQLEQFPSLGASSSSTSAAQAATNNPASSNWAAAAKKKPPPASTPGGTPSGTSSGRPAPTPAAAAARRSAAVGHAGAAAGPEEVPWVETGAAVSRQYAAARAEARDAARVRNACFQQATQAYLAGDKALAKQLSAQGRAAAEAMWAAHEAASNTIFNSRNTTLVQQAAAGGGSRSGRPAAVIDLHGLHVQEAMQLVPQQLAALSAQRHASASVIVGAGRHTKGAPSARMGPAVTALLRELGYSFTEPQPGLLRVRLR